MKPTLRQLEYAVAVADHRHFRRAARACHVSQPGLSAQLRQLEELWGIRLFERNRRRVHATPAGRELVARARGVLAAVDELTGAARALREPLTGPLRLGVIPTVAPYLLPRALPEVRRRHPELELALHEDRTARLVEKLREGGLDLLLLALEAPLGRPGELALLPLFRDEFQVAASRRHPLAGRRRLREAELLDESVLLLEDGHCLRDQALAVCSAAGANEAGDFRAGSLSTLVQMVAAGTGLTLLPSLALPVELQGDELVAIPFEAPAPARTIGLVWRSSSGQAEAFARLGELLARGRNRPRAAGQSRLGTLSPESTPPSTRNSDPVQ